MNRSSHISLIISMLLTISCLPACGDDSAGREPGSSSRAGTDGGSAEPDNRSACLSYVETFNALSCVTQEAEIDTASACPAGIDSSGCDATDYFQCLENAVGCMDVAGMSVPDAQATTACTAPSCL
jgi:hypothetical protein